MSISGIIETTLACNFNCIHCGSHAGVKREKELTLLEIEALLSDLKDLNCQGVTYMGGEFFLRKDWMDILKLTEQNQIPFEIITNGYLVTEKKIKAVNELGVNKYLTTSLDFATAEKHDEFRGKAGSFKKVFKTLRLAKKYNMRPAVITTVNKKNVDELEDIYKRLLKLKFPVMWKVLLASCHGNKFSQDYVVDEETFLKTAKFVSEKKCLDGRVKVSETHDLGYCSERYPNLGVEFSKSGCLSGTLGFGVQSNGNVKGCLALPDEFIEGNIRKRSFKEIWNDPEKFSITRKFDKSKLEGYCKTCEKNNECKGGCRDFNYTITGSVYDTPFCLHRIYNTL
jgi:radical SAM protein with 4Fe4S-binding SPASM domain